MALVLVLGGTRSGKSEVAEALASDAGAPVTYLATGTASDAEMAERIAAHRARRPPHWQTIETDDPLASLTAAGDATVLLDSLGSWIAASMLRAGLLGDGGAAGPRATEPGPGQDGLLARGGDGLLARGGDGLLAPVRALAEAAAARPALTVVVAEESGLGPVAPTAATRHYLDLAGEATQAISAVASRALLVVAGRALALDRLTRPEMETGELPGSVSGELSGDARELSGDARELPRDAGERPEETGELPEEAGELPRLRSHGDTMVPAHAEDFAVNVEHGSRPSWLEAALARALHDSEGYPEEHDTVAAVARSHGRRPEEVVLLNGGVEAFWLLAAALRPRRAVCVHPSFTEPEAALRAHGHPVERAFRNPTDFRLDPAAVPPTADLVVTGNPNNPSGTLDAAHTVAAMARPGRVLVVDEAFMSFVPGESESLADRDDLPGVVVVRSLTKLWSLAGLRAGYLLAPRAVAAALRRMRPPWNQNALALAAVRACAERPGAADAAAERVAKARESLQARLRRVGGLRTWPSAANFILARVRDGEQVRRRLLEQGVAVRPGHTFPGLSSEHLRLTVRSEDANARLVAALEEAAAALEEAAV